MSLVNDMLRDLEQRNERPTEVPGNDSSVKAAQYVEATPESKTPRLILWLIGAAAVSTTLWLLWQDQATEPVVVADTPKITAVKDKQTRATNETRTVVTTEPASVQPRVNEPKAVIVAEVPNLSQSSSSVQKESIAPTVLEESTVSEETAETIAINEIKWAGTDFGGDLVVRLNGDADVQVLNQKGNSIVVAFDDVAMRTTLPFIASPFIERLDMDVDSEQGRTLLTLTTYRPSQFAFRVQQTPTTLILGVIPKQERPVSTDEELAVSSGIPDTVEPDASVEEEKTTALRSGEALHVMSSAQDEGKKTVRPVAKSTKALNDSQSADRARAMVNRGDIAGAENILRTIVAKGGSKAVNSRVLLSTLLLSQGKTADAQLLVTPSLKLHSGNSQLKKLQARLWITDNQSEKAASLLSQSPPPINKDPEYYELMATAWQQQGSPDKAANIYYQLLQQNNDMPRWWVGMGYALEQGRRYSDARNAYQSGIQIPSIDSSLKNYARQRIQALAGH